MLYSYVTYLEKLAKDASRTVVNALGAGATATAAPAVPTIDGEEGGGGPQGGAAATGGEGNGPAGGTDEETFERDEGRGLLRGTLAGGGGVGGPHGGELRARTTVA